MKYGLLSPASPPAASLHLRLTRIEATLWNFKKWRGEIITPHFRDQEALQSVKLSRLKLLDGEFACCWFDIAEKCNAEFPRVQGTLWLRARYLNHDGAALWKTPGPQRLNPSDFGDFSPFLYSGLSGHLRNHTPDFHDMCCEYLAWGVYCELMS